MEIMIVKLVQNVSPAHGWNNEVRTYLLCGCAVEVLNPDNVMLERTMTLRVTGTPQQIRNAECALAESEAQASW